MYTVGLVRVSSRKQEDGLSIANQSQRLHAAGCDLLLEYTESGFKKNRQTFDKLQELVLTGQVKSVKAIRVDRAGRLVQELLALVDYLQSHNVSIEFFDVPSDLSTASGRLMLTQMAAFAEYFSRELSEKQKSVNAYKREHGIPRFGLFGYQFDGRDRVLVQDTKLYGDTGETIWEIARKVALQIPIQGSARGTIKWIFDNYGPKRLNPQREDIPRSAIGLKEWAMNPALRGYLHYPQYGILKLGQHKPLITEAEFQQIETTLALSSKRRGFGSMGNIHPLSGLIYCVCGSICSFSRGGNANSPRHYYGCHKHKISRCPNQPPDKKRRKLFREDLIEAALIQEFSAAAKVITDKVALETNTSTGKTPARILEIDNEISQYTGLLSGSMGELAKEAIARLEIEKKTILSQQSTDPSERLDYVITALQNPNFFEILSPTEKRSIYRWLVERIVISSDSIVEIKLKL